MGHIFRIVMPILQGSRTDRGVNRLTRGIALGTDVLTRPLRAACVDAKPHKSNAQDNHGTVEVLLKNRSTVVDRSINRNIFHTF